MTSEIDAAVTALRSGNVKDAFARLKAADEAAPLSDQGLLALAHAARSLERYEDCIGAIDRFQKNNPASPDAALIKADAFKGLGETRNAAAFYRSFLQLTQRIQPFPAHLQPEIARAQKEIEGATAAYEEYLREKISGAGFDAGAGTSRLGQAIDIMFGRKSVYPQSPSKFYFPELPQIQFYDMRKFEWAPAVLDQVGQIRDELLELISSDESFDPYVQHSVNAPKISEMGQQLLGRHDWSAYHLHQDGAPQPKHITRCPKTLEILEAAPIPKIRSISPSILFSRLAAGAHIPPHSGVCNARLICHLPLLVPRGCWLRVGNQIREWTEGEMLIFDDTIEHEAKNPTSETRVVLLFDVWRPELSGEERAFVETLFDAVESFSAEPA